MHKYKQYIPYLTVLAILWVLLGVIYFYTPYVIDDEDFRNYLSECFAHPSFSTFIESCKESFIYRFNYDNGRIFNLIAPIFLILPKWILSAFLSGCSIANIYLIARISGTWQRSTGVLGLIIFLYIIGLPWADYMFTAMFSLNYVTASIPSLLINYLFLKQKDINRLKSFLLGAFAAWCHEGIAGPTALGLIVAMAVYREYRRPFAWYTLAGMSAGIFYLLFLVPGTIVRTTVANYSFGIIHLFQYIHHIGPLALLCLITICARFIKRWWRSINKPALLTIYGACAGSFALWLIWMTGARLTWYLNLSSILGIAIALAPLTQRMSRRMNVIIALITITTVYAHLIACIPYARLYMQDYNNIRALKRSSESEDIYYDAHEPWEAPRYLLGKVNYNGLYGWTKSTRIALPTALKHFRPENAERATCNVSPAYLFDKLYVVIEDYEGRSERDVINFIAENQPRVSYSYITPFTGADGKKYLYCRPGVVSLRKKWENVSGVIITRAN